MKRNPSPGRVRKRRMRAVGFPPGLLFNVMMSVGNLGASHLPPPPEGARSLSVEPTTEGLRQVREAIDEALEQAAYDRTNGFAVRIALEEAISNAARHGSASSPASPSSPSPSSPIEVVFHITPESVYLRITDHGPGFDPASIPDPTLDENIQSGAGRGLLLMRAYMSTVQYNPSGNAVVMIRRNP